MDWRGVSSLAGERVVYQYGFDPQDLLPVAFLLQPVFDLASAFHMLDRKLAAYALDDASLLRSAMAETDYGSDQFMISPIKTLEVSPIFADTETGRALRDTYDRRMAELMDSGAVEAILRRGGLDESKLARILDAVSESLPKAR
jgi:polar amino acid transport system substrate-binding protein